MKQHSQGLVRLVLVLLVILLLAGVIWQIQRLSMKYGPC